MLKINVNIFSIIVLGVCIVHDAKVQQLFYIASDLSVKSVKNLHFAT